MVDMHQVHPLWLRLWKKARFRTFLMYTWFSYYIKVEALISL